MTAEDTDEFDRRWAAAPPRLTRRDIARLADRSLAAVRKWVVEEGFPAALPERGPQGTTYYPRDAVAAWVRTVATSPHRRGDRLALPAAAGRSENAADTGENALTAAELAARYGITRRALNYYARRYASAPDPFPPADPTGRRPSTAVDAWLHRHHSHPPPRGNPPKARKSTPTT
ncbi:hypothetical protein LO772_22630 [Yinghuangia sp. ASG 101]|uniref:hypothetical protein n=1 Tax=Yinghuangia sp. ASG 101 TaxID=2896848 RepID=UPI001E34348E|nr:hypothetical protein [Yinghuangia sp. ASG 101]UGQ15701.1 hypothetical protein LO772_22630 [Yinghuangia sp. ASG 101]